MTASWLPSWARPHTLRSMSTFSATDIWRRTPACFGHCQLVSHLMIDESGLPRVPARDRRVGEVRLFRTSWTCNRAATQSSLRSVTRSPRLRPCTTLPTSCARQPRKISPRSSMGRSRDPTPVVPRAASVQTARGDVGQGAVRRYPIRQRERCNEHQRADRQWGVAHESIGLRQVDERRREQRLQRDDPQQHPVGGHTHRSKRCVVGGCCGSCGRGPALPPQAKIEQVTNP